MSDVGGAPTPLVAPANENCPPHKRHLRDIARARQILLKGLGESAPRLERSGCYNLSSKTARTLDDHLNRGRSDAVFCVSIAVRIAYYESPSPEPQLVSFSRPRPSNAALVAVAYGAAFAEIHTNRRRKWSRETLEQAALRLDQARDIGREAVQCAVDEVVRNELFV